MFSIGLVGGLLRCFLCLRQVDLKSFIAYSSVCHMGFGLCGFMSNTFGGVRGFVIMLIAHGYISSCLFYILYLFYKRFHSRRSLFLKGLGIFSFVLVFFVFLFSIMNLGVPPSFSFFSEVLILVGRGSLSFINLALVGILLFCTGLYNIFFFVILGHGSSIFRFLGLRFFVREFLIL